VTGQHQSMLQQVLDLFGIVPAHNLAAMTANQTLNGLAGRLFAGLDFFDGPHYVSPELVEGLLRLREPGAAQ